MAIKFACPACKTTYTVNDRDAGKKSDCKVCGQRLQVPTPPRQTKTVLGEFVEPTPPVPPPHPEPIRPESNREQLPRRTRRPIPTGLIAFGIVGGLFLAAALGVLALILSRGA